MQEIKAMELKRTWEIFDLLVNRTLYGCKCVYKIKYKSNGSIDSILGLQLTIQYNKHRLQQRSKSVTVGRRTTTEIYSDDQRNHYGRYCYWDLQWRSQRWSANRHRKRFKKRKLHLATGKRPLLYVMVIFFPVV